MSTRHHVFLLPGFLGFDNLGDLAYFAHVTEALEAGARRLGVETRVHVVPTSPTASLRQRAAFATETIAAALSAPDAGLGPVHLLGHSSGGLDARLVVTPQVSLPTQIASEPVAARVRTVVTVATPHYGTPLAHFFTSLLGQQILKVLSVSTSYILRTGRLPLDVLARLTALLIKPPAAGAVGANAGLDQIVRRLAAELSSGRSLPFEAFVDHISRDQDLLPQLTPAAMDLYNASTDDRPGIRYGAVVTQAGGASVRSFLAAGFSPYMHANHALYVCLDRLAAGMPADRVPAFTDSQRQALRRDFSSEPRRQANDGVVPTVSQVRGEIIRCVRADHLDVIGHFPDAKHIPPHFDWLASGSGFGRAAFVALWDDICRYLFRQ